MKEEWSRSALVLGEDALETLSHAHVAVFGVGGVGSYATEALARAGVGALTLIDSDRVSLSNINRQLIALHSTVGRDKVAVAAERIHDINPDCRVQTIVGTYCADDRERFWCDYDYVADCIDMVSAKLDLICTAQARKIPILSAMGTGNKLDPSLLQITDLSKTEGCALARVMRRELRKRGIVHSPVLFSPEPPLPPQTEALPDPGRRSVPGSISWVPSCAGLMLGGAIIRALIAKYDNPERKSE